MQNSHTKGSQKKKWEKNYCGPPSANRPAIISRLQCSKVNGLPYFIVFPEVVVQEIMLGRIGMLHEPGLNFGNHCQRIRKCSIPCSTFRISQDGRMLTVAQLPRLAPLHFILFELTHSFFLARPAATGPWQRVPHIFYQGVNWLKQTSSAAQLRLSV